MFSVIVDEVFEPQKVFPLSSIPMRPFGTEKPRPMPTRDDPLRRLSTFSYSLDMSPGASSIRLTPSGRLHPALHDGGGDFPDEILDAFARSEAEGLFELAARRGLTRFRPSSRTGATSLLACSRFAAGAPRVRSPSSPWRLSTTKAPSRSSSRRRLSKGRNTSTPRCCADYGPSSTSGCEPKRARSAGWGLFGRSGAVLAPGV